MGPNNQVTHCLHAGFGKTRLHWDNLCVDTNYTRGSYKTCGSLVPGS